MSGLLGSRSAADSSVAIAAFQSSATSAFFPAANSGSSFAQSASEVPTVMVQIGQSSDPGFASEVRSESPRDGAIAASHTDVGMVYAATPPTSAPQIEASMIERIMMEFRVIFHHRARNALASRTSGLSVSAFLTRFTSLPKYSEA